MKNYTKFQLIAILFLFYSCGQKSSENIKNNDKEVPSKEVPRTNTQNKTYTENDVLSDFKELVPLEIVNPQSENPYKKYGIEFQGNCYDCDSKN